MRVVTGVHLVGSVPLRDAETVFRRVSAALGDRVRRMPDGETGERSEWIAWQYPVFRRSPLFEPADDDGDGFAPLRLRPGAPVEDLEFGELGYARAALASWETFARLKADGVVPEACRFLLSLPTPLGPIAAFVAPEDQLRVEEAYENHMLAELRRVLAGIPHDELAVQWDARYEFSVLEGALSISLGGDDAPRHPRSARAPLAQRPRRGRARLPPLLRRRGARPLRRAGRRAPSRRRRRRAGHGPAPPPGLDPHAGAARARRRRLLRPAARPPAAAGDRALPRADPPRRRPRRDAGADRRRAAPPADVRRGDRMRLGTRGRATVDVLLDLHRAVCRPVVAGAR